MKLKATGRTSRLLLYALLVVVNSIAWYPVLNFWFFRGWEQSWLIGVCGYSFTVLCLMKGHGFLYLLNYLLFGWNPTGWYLTALILHIIAVLLMFAFTKYITKNTIFAFIVAVLFSVHVNHNDVVNWGSFEGLYALMMVVFFAGIFSFLQFRKQAGARRYGWYMLTIVIFLFGLFVRESAILLPIFIGLTDLLLTYVPAAGLQRSLKLKKTFLIVTKNYAWSFLQIMLPFILITVGYLVFRSWYGGAPHDQIDAMVLLRGALIAQGDYLEYLWRGILSFGKFAASHVIPYPVLNSIRDILFRIFPSEKILYFFFPVLGIIYTFLQIFIIYYYRKNAQLRNLLIFSFLWYVIPTLFFSFAFSITDYILVGAYQWDSSRWRYFALFGTLVYWVALGFTYYHSLLQQYKHRTGAIRNIAIVSIVGYFLLNILLLRSIQHEMYLTTFKPPRDFYTKFLQEFKTLPKEYVFYIYPFASPLNDFISEWYYLRQAYYPYLTENRGNSFSETHVGMLLDRVNNKTTTLQNTYFLDYNPTDGLQNKTKQVKTIIAGQREQSYAVNMEVPTATLSAVNDSQEHQLTISLNPQIHVETPHIFEILLTGYGTEGIDAVREKNIPFSSFVANRMNFLKDTRVTVCKTAPIGARGAPAEHLLPTHLIDGNFGRRSWWVADCKPAWVILALGKTKDVGGLAMHAGKTSTNVPYNYTIETSLDGKRWQTMETITGNTAVQRIHLFNESIRANYVRFSVSQTTEGQMLTLDALEIIHQDDRELTKEYNNNFEALVYDSYDHGGGVLKFSWETDPNNWQAFETIQNNSFYVPFELDNATRTISIEPNESEFYSTNTQFLKRKITTVHLDFTGSLGNVFVDSVTVKPKYEVN